MKFKLVASLNEFCRTDLVKSAKPEDEFVVLKRSDILDGRTPEGNIALKKDAVIATIRKDELEGAGYGQDDSDEVGGSANVGADRDAQLEMARGLHKGIKHLMKHHGMFRKAAGITDDEIVGDENGDQETNDMPGDASGEEVPDEFGKTRRTGNLNKAAVGKMITDSNATLLAAVTAVIEKSAAAAAPPIQTRQDGAGTPITKTAAELAGGEGDAPKGDLEKAYAQMIDWKAKKDNILGKLQKNIQLTPEEAFIRDTVSTSHMGSVDVYNGLLRGTVKEFIEIS